MHVHNSRNVTAGRKRRKDCAEMGENRLLRITQIINVQGRQ
jgi:hypothetical protein